MAKDKKPIRRVVSVEFWRDDKVMDSFSPEDKLFMLYLLTNPQSTQLGIYHINKKTMAYELGYSPETITVLLDRFENTYGMIKYSPETHEIAIKNYLRHSILAGGLPVEDLLRKELLAVEDKSLVDYAFTGVMNDKDLNASVRKIINEFYALQKVNDDSYHDSLDDSYNDSYPINNQLSIINNHSSNTNHSNSNNMVVVVNNNNINTNRARTREETNHHHDENMTDAFTDDETLQPTETLEVYAANNIINMNGRNMELLVGFREWLPDDVIRYAIDLANRCCKTGVPTYNYVEKILMGYTRQKIQTVEQAQMLEKAREADREKQTKRVVKMPQRKTAEEESADFWGRVKTY